MGDQTRRSQSPITTATDKATTTATRTAISTAKAPPATGGIGLRASAAGGEVPVLSIVSPDAVGAVAVRTAGDGHRRLLPGESAVEAEGKQQEEDDAGERFRSGAGDAGSLVGVVSEIAVVVVSGFDVVAVVELLVVPLVA